MLTKKQVVKLIHRILWSEAILTTSACVLYLSKQNHYAENRLELTIIEGNIRMVHHLKKTQEAPVTIEERTSISYLPTGLNTDSYESLYGACDAHHLMHCYQLALDFGVPTAQRALALYKSELAENPNTGENGFNPG